MKKLTQLVATLSTDPASSRAALTSLDNVASWLEVRADLAGDLSPTSLRGQFPGQLLYSLRGRGDGGRWAEHDAVRRNRLLAAAAQYDLVELDSQRDLVPDVLNGIPPHKRLVAWHGAEGESASLGRELDRLAMVHARFYKIVPFARCAADGLVALRLLKSLGREDVITFAAGSAGVWSRLVAPYFGCPLLFGTIGDGSKDGAEPSIEQLVRDYGFPALRPIKAMYGIAGAEVARSLSPRLHNAAYCATNLPALFVPFQVDGFAEFWRDFVDGSDLARLGMPLRGVTVASPNKENAATLAFGRSAMATQACSANVLHRVNELWQADTTDPDGVLLNLQRRAVDLRDKPAAVIG